MWYEAQRLRRRNKEGQREGIRVGEEEEEVKDEENWGGIYEKENRKK